MVACTLTKLRFRLDRDETFRLDLGWSNDLEARAIRISMTLNVAMMIIGICEGSGDY